jgi:hypothetical protein
MYTQDAKATNKESIMQVPRESVLVLNNVIPLRRQIIRTETLVSNSTCARRAGGSFELIGLT